MSTYSPAHKKYYEKCKEIIRWRTRKYRKAYNAEYYEQNRDALLAKKKEKYHNKIKALAESKETEEKPSVQQICLDTQKVLDNPREKEKT